MTDYEHAYRGLRERLTAELRTRDERAVEVPSPCTPEWRVRDVVAHLGGVCDDVAHGNMDGVATDAWTRAQVDKRRDWPFGDVLDDWTEHAAVVEPMMNAIGRPMGQMVFDAWTHEQDVRSALGLACDRDSEALDVSFDWWLSTALLMTPAGSGEAPPIRLVTEAGEVTLGVGEPVHTLATSRFELLRTITGRRSVAQVQRLDFDGDAPLDELVLAGDFFRPATHDIVE